MSVVHAHAINVNKSSATSEGRIVHLPARGSFFARVSASTAGRPAVVLLHGLGATAELNWSTTIPALSASFRVVAPDVRGHGRAVAEQHRFTLEDAADDVAALAEAMALGPFIVVGYSMGGAIAQLVCRRHPEQVRGLVLCATSRSFSGSLRERALFSALPSVRVASRAIPNEVARAATRRIVARLVGERLDSRLEEFVRIFDVDQVLEAAGALGGYRSHDWIGSLDLPSAVLVHLRDQLVPSRRQFELAHALPHAVVHPVDGDHFAAVKKPHAFVSALVNAVRDVHRRAYRSHVGFVAEARAV